MSGDSERGHGETVCGDVCIYITDLFVPTKPEIISEIM